MILDKLLTSLDVTVDPFALCNVRHGWSFSLPPEGFTSLHFCVQGSGVLQVAGGPPLPFSVDDLLVVPPGTPHRLEFGGEVEDVLEVAEDGSAPVFGMKQLGPSGADDESLAVACGAVRATYSGAIGLFDGLRHPIVTSFADDARMRLVFSSMLAEQADPGPGSQAMLRAMMTQCLVALLRRLCGHDCGLDWLAVLEDERLARAIEAMVDEPAASHSLESVARIAGMSRSAFSKRFSDVMGRSAMEFLREVRLQRGARLLRETDLPVKAVAQKIGFRSRSHFSRAFRAQFGDDPATYRAE